MWIETAFQGRLYYLEIRGDIEVSWGEQAVVADMQQLVKAAHAIGSPALGKNAL